MNSDGLESYTTGTGQHIKVHNRERCKDQFCPIHNPSDHHMKDWPTNWRGDIGVMERICPHGIGHPDPDDLFYKSALGITWPAIHGCDGCCSSERKIRGV